MSKENLGRDISGAVDFSLPQCSEGANVLLTANTESTYVAPAGYNRAFLSYSVGTNVWFDINTSINIPSTNSFATNTAELNPSIRQLNPTFPQTLHFKSDTAAYVQIRFDKGSPI